ncbi:uncharacterized protein BDZ99DRAFT_401670, partial [Mytilinidion resinicola]
RISPNLEEALRSLRSETTPRAIWTDAICIDQSNIQERGHQIGLMQNIHSFASNVVIWLGPATPATATGIDILSFLAGSDGFDGKCSWEHLSPALLCDGLNDVMGRPYFRRMWVVQEAALAGKIDMRIGDYSVPWQRGQAARRFLFRLKFAEISPKWEHAGLHEVDMRPLIEVLEMNVRQDYRERGHVLRPGLLDIAHHIRHRVASDRRDKIFALLGLSPDGFDIHGLVDYTMSTEEVFRAFHGLVEKECFPEMEDLDMDEEVGLDPDRALPRLA